MTSSILRFLAWFIVVAIFAAAYITIYHFVSFEVAVLVALAVIPIRNDD